MKIQTSRQGNHHLSNAVYSKLTRMLSPTLGVVQEIGYMKRSSVDPFLITIGAELTGVHHLLNRNDPGKGGYHIGGGGYFHDEAMIKALSESMERYSQLLSEFHLKGVLPRKFLSYKEMLALQEPLLEKKYLQIFEEKQFADPCFPFSPFDENKPLSWIQMPSLDQKRKLWVPTQMLFIGYSCQRPKEPWISAAVTTGTASHKTREKAILGAISELIQIDAAMGHWYTDAQAIPLHLDGRVKTFLKFQEKVQDLKSGISPRFYLLESRGLPGFNIACVYERPAPHIPQIAVGLGSNTKLERALYQAYLEACGVAGLARLNVYKEKHVHKKTSDDNTKIYDLDSNIVSYALGSHHELFSKKFPSKGHVKTSDLPPDWTFEHDEEAVQFFLKSFADQKKELLYVDLTPQESRKLGFHIARVWCPDTLPLCLPSAVHKKHPRFADYNGVVHEIPHPYP